jgi:hypothetical protein
MAETALHHRLVRILVSRMQASGIRITHAAGIDGFPDPRRVGRHEPDVIGNKDGITYFGEAKTGVGDLWTEHSLEQFYDFSHRRHRASNRPWCPFILAVPRSVAIEARDALAHAGARMENTRLISPPAIRRRRAA